MRWLGSTGWRLGILLGGQVVGKRSPHAFKEAIQKDDVEERDTPRARFHIEPDACCDKRSEKYDGGRAATKIDAETQTCGNESGNQSPTPNVVIRTGPTGSDNEGEKQTGQC